MFRLLQLCLCDKHVDVMYTSMLCTAEMVFTPEIGKIFLLIKAVLSTCNGQ